MACESIVGFAHSTISGHFSKSSHSHDHPWMVTEHLSQYCGRELSFDPVAIDAFMGVFNEYGCQRYPVSHYFGVPIMPGVIAAPNGRPKQWNRSKTESFAAGLCWRSTRPVLDASSFRRGVGLDGVFR